MKLDTSFRSIELYDLVEYSPIGNSYWAETYMTEGIVVGIEIMRDGKDAFITIEQVKPMKTGWSPNDYKVGSVSTIGYGEIFRSLSLIKILKRRARMNEIIIEMFPVTKEAVIVDKWFGREIDKPIFKMLIKGKEKELFAEATRLEETSKNK